MRLLKRLFILCVVILLSGCAKKTDEPIMLDIDEISVESLQYYFSHIKMDVNYPYGIDYFFKERFRSVSDIDEYWFEKLSPASFVEGDNPTAIRAVYPDGEETILHFNIFCNRTEYPYDSRFIRFDKETQTITGFTSYVQKIVIPEEIDGVRVKHIGANAFREKMMYEVYIPNTILSIGDRAFEYNQLSSLILPPSVEYVGKRAFAFNAFTTIVLEERLLSFGDFVLADNPVEEVILRGDSNLTQVGLHWRRSGLPLALMPGMQVDRGVYYSEETKTVYGYDAPRDRPVFSSGINSIIEELDVNHIGDYAFYDIPINQFEVPNNIISIGKYAYAYSIIDTLIIPSTIAFIDDYAFIGNEIMELQLFDSVTHFGESVFDTDAIYRVIIHGNETHYNEIWEDIGLPLAFKPIHRDPIDTISSWSSSKNDILIDYIEHNQIIYGIGITWGNDGDFEHDKTESDTISFLFAYDLVNQTKQTILLVEPVYHVSSIVMGENGNLIIAGCTFILDGYQYSPYFLYFDLDLNFIEAKPIQANIDLPHKIIVNDAGEILLLASSYRSSPIDSVLILSQEGTILYQYTIPSGVINLNFQDVCVDGNDFVLVGWVRALSYITSDNGNHIEAYSMRLNKNGVVWEVRHNHTYMKRHFKIINHNGLFFISGNTHLTDPYDHQSYLIIMDANGEIQKEINTSPWDIIRVNTIQIVDDVIYLIANDSYAYMYSSLFMFDVSLNYLDKKPFIQIGHNIEIIDAKNNGLLILCDSSDRYLNSNIITNDSNLYIFSFDK